MIKFDVDSIKHRAISKLQQDPNWNIVTSNSVVSALIDSNAEINAETARYAEYLFKESKWDTAQNPSSILSMANMLGYQPKRKISATGRIYVSIDPRTHNVGKTISFNEFKNLKSSDEDRYKWASPSKPIEIDTDATIVDSRGNSYVANPLMFDTGTKQATLQIIQGKRKSVFVSIDTIRSTATVSKLDPYLYIPVEIKDCENANNVETKAFFRVYLVTEGNVEPIEYRVVDTLLLSSASDRDVEVYNDLYSQNFFYLKFNNDSVRGQTVDISANSSLSGIRIDYLESLGAQGNLLDNFENFTITNIKNAPGKRLFGINAEPFINGRDEESITDIRVNAPRYYMSNYTAGTKEAYENVIKNMQFTVGGTKIADIKSVQVYGSHISDGTGNTWPITCVSFLASNLEDIVTKTITTDSDSTNPYDAIDESLNYYLAKLKSPQDTLKFVPPTYVSFAIGVSCSVDRTKVDDIAQLENSIRDTVDDDYGTKSSNLDFGRAISPSSIITKIKNSYPAVRSVDIEIEAIKKLNWDEATRKAPKNDTGNNTVKHTIRVPFSFSPIFLGNLQANKGFKDFRVSAGYVMRIDFMYKKPRAMPNAKDYHVSIFIKDGQLARQFTEGNSTKTTRSFYLVKDTTPSGIWEKDFSKASSDYSADLTGISQLKESQQFYYKKQVFSDNDYLAMIDDSNEGYSSTLDSDKIAKSRGAIADYLVYFSANYDDSSKKIGDGWLELPFDSLYNTLTYFANFDSGLLKTLMDVPLSKLDCGTENVTEPFKRFVELLNKYVDVYVSMRPVDPHLRIKSNVENSGSTVLYVDSFDNADAKNNIRSLTESKRPRMISVKCSYEN